MGRVLQRTSISTNIKERLDFSCAVFGPDGGLVSNAPHIPVHLGAMQETVQYQVQEVYLPYVSEFGHTIEKPHCDTKDVLLLFLLLLLCADQIVGEQAERRRCDSK